MSQQWKLKTHIHTDSHEYRREHNTHIEQAKSTFMYQLTSVKHRMSDSADQ